MYSREAICWRAEVHSCCLRARYRQAVKPAKDLKTFLGNSLGHHGPFAPSSGDLDSGWEVR